MLTNWTNKNALITFAHTVSTYVNGGTDYTKYMYKINTLKKVNFRCEILHSKWFLVASHHHKLVGQEDWLWMVCLLTLSKRRENGSVPLELVRV